LFSLVPDVYRHTHDKAQFQPPVRKIVCSARRRSPQQPDALDTPAVVTTPAGMKAVTDCQYVRAVLEDQPVGPIEN